MPTYSRCYAHWSLWIVFLSSCLSCSLAMKIINSLSSKDTCPEVPSSACSLFSPRLFFLPFSFFRKSILSCSFRATHLVCLWLFTYTMFIALKYSFVVVVVVSFWPLNCNRCSCLKALQDLHTGGGGTAFFFLELFPPTSPVLITHSLDKYIVYDSVKCCFSNMLFSVIMLFCIFYHIKS